MGWFDDDTWSQDTIARDAAERRRESDELIDAIPAIDQLAPRYAHERGVYDDRDAPAAAGARSHSDAQLEALQLLGDRARTSDLTAADRAQMQQARLASEQSARAMRDSALRAMEARGMGGSGAALAARLAGDEGAATRGAALESDMLSSAQMRQMAAMQAYGQLGTQQRGQSFSEDMARRGALDDWTARELDYRRGMDFRGTERTNEERRGRAGAYGDQWGMRRDAYRDRWGMGERDTDRSTGERNRRQERDDERTASLIEGGTSIVGGAAGGFG